MRSENRQREAQSLERFERHPYDEMDFFDGQQNRLDTADAMLSAESLEIEDHSASSDDQHTITPTK